jgi:hypothetical protein
MFGKKKKKTPVTAGKPVATKTRKKPQPAKHQAQTATKRAQIKSDSESASLKPVPSRNENPNQNPSAVSNKNPKPNQPVQSSINPEEVAILRLRTDLEKLRLQVEALSAHVYRENNPSDQRDSNSVDSGGSSSIPKELLLKTTEIAIAEMIKAEYGQAWFQLSEQEKQTELDRMAPIAKSQAQAIIQFILDEY